MPRELKVGLLIVLAIAVLAAGVFLIGDRDHVFSTKNRYTVLFESVGGLAPGANVQLSGVGVGQVERIDLPPNAQSSTLTVVISIDRKYRDRIRKDSLARIKTVGLLGDKFIDITSGTPTAEIIGPGGIIPAAPPTDVDQLISSGEDFVANVLAMSVSMRAMLARMESGEGVLGQLTSDSETAETMRQTLQAMERVLVKIDRGEGTLGKLLRDDAVFVNLEGTLARLENSVTKLEQGEGMLGLLMSDEAARQRLERSLANLDSATESLSELSAALKEGDGLIPTLLSDPDYGKQVASDLKEITANLRKISEKLESGDGTVAQLINDEETFQALNDVLIGVNENKFLRWMIRNRQKKGIKKRYEDAVEAGELEPIQEDQVP